MKNNRSLLLVGILSCSVLMNSVPVSPVFAAEETPETAQEKILLTVTFLAGEGGSFADGAMSTSFQTSHVTIGLKNIPEVFCRDGYTFRGWMVDGNSKMIYTTNQLARIVVTSHHNIEAVYNRASFDLTISAGEHGTFADGGVSESRSVLVEDAIGTLPEVTAAEGYEFTGWLINDQLYTPEQAAAVKMPAAAMTAVALYEEKVQMATVTFDAGEHGKINGQDSASVEIKAGTMLSADQIPAFEAAEGYVFKGWSDGTKTYTDEELLTLAVPAEGLRLTAICDKKAEETVKVILNAGDHGVFEDGHKTQTIDALKIGTVLSDIALPEVKTDEGWKLLGWSVDGKTVLSTEEMKAMKLEANTELTAVYEKAEAEKPAEPEKPADQNKNDQNKNDKNDKNNQTETKKDTRSSKSKSAKTGLASGAAVYGATGAIAAASAGILAWLRRKNR